MSRFESEFSSAGEARLDLAELFAALASGVVGDAQRRQAIACLLSAGTGWRDAAIQLGGTFADGVAAATGLRDGKEG